VTDLRKLAERIAQSLYPYYARDVIGSDVEQATTAIERILYEHHNELNTDVLEAMCSEDTEGWDPVNIVRREFRRVLEGESNERAE